MSNFMNMKNNLIQNFYIIGITPDDISTKMQDILSYTPKIISKFPDIKNYNTIPNELIIEHCFPMGYKPLKGKKKDLEKNVYNFWFELDNLKYNYLSKYRMIYSKIYFTCLKFNECFHSYEKLKSEKKLADKINNNDTTHIKDNNINSLIDDNTLFFPKVICFASLLPFNKELSKLLNNLYDYFNYYNTKLNNNLNNDVSLTYDLSPIEKIVEQIIIELPFPISLKNDYAISYKFNFPININNTISPISLTPVKCKSSSLTPSQTNQSFPYNNKNINFQKYDPLNTFMSNITSIPLSVLFSYFTEEEVLKIFKYIILEIPILFFSENIELLTLIIEGFLSLIFPFEYVQPYASILPSKFYGIINTENKFIFGINENYTPDFFKSKNIILDKTIIAVHFVNQKAKIEEIKKIEDQKDYVIIDNYNIFNFINNDSLLPNGAKIDIINIEFPLKHKKKIISRIKSYINESKKKKSNFAGDNNNFNQKIRYSFYKFFTNILCGFTDYIQRIYKYDINDYKKEGFHYGDSIRFKIDYSNNYNINSNKENLIIKNFFNMDEFISKFPKDNHIFYKVFCNTKLFYNFIRKQFFTVDDQVSLSNKYFNVITFFKKHKELKKQYKYNEQFMTYEDPFKLNNLTNSDSKIFIPILNDMSFNSDEKNILIEKKTEALNNYYQIVNMKNISINDNTPVKYIIFPKLLYDNSFFNISYDKLFYRHYLELPTNSEILYLYKNISKLIKEYDDKYQDLIFSKNQNEANNSSKNIIDVSRHSNSNQLGNNNTNGNLEVLVDNYIEYNWLLLISCSLWYCQSPIEIDFRINKIFDVLEKIEFIEEQVLFFLYMAIYKYGTKSHFIKMFEFMNRFMGYSRYINLLYLCTKLNKKESDNMNKNDDNNSNKNLKVRSFFDHNEIKETLNSSLKSNNSSEININISTENNSINNSGSQKEEINFYTLQICPKCKAENKIADICKMIHHRISKKREKLIYKCSQCGTENLEIKIKYKLVWNNKKKGESLDIKEGYFILIPPHKIYQEIKDYIMSFNECQLDIDNIFSNDKIHLLNNIFYFSEKLHPFDFLIPYEGQGNRIYFFEDKEGCEEVEENEIKNEIIENNKQKLEIFSINNCNNFSIITKK